MLTLTRGGFSIGWTGICQLAMLLGCCRIWLQTDPSMD